MRCRSHAKPWEYQTAALRYLVWCLAPQLAVVDRDALRYISKELVWAQWEAYMENISELPPKQRFEVTAWMMEHMDEVHSGGGWIHSDGFYVRNEPGEVWGPARELDEVGSANGLTRSELGVLVGGVSGTQMRKLVQGYAWPRTQRIMWRIPLLVERLREELGERGAVEQRAYWMEYRPEGRRYDLLMKEAHTWNPSEEAMVDRYSSATLTGERSS